MPGSKLSPETIAEIKRLRYEERKSSPEVAKLLGVAKSTVLAHSPGVDTHFRVDRDEVMRLRSEKFSIEEIAEAVGASPRYVRELLPERDARYQVKHGPEIKARALAMLEDRQGYAEVARTLGINQQTLARWHPGLGLTHAEGGHIGQLNRRANKILDNAQNGGYNGR